MDYCRIASLSCFALFLDLERAFDKVIREILVGWPQTPNGEEISDPEQQLKYLISIGVHHEAADYVVEQVGAHGCVFDRWGIDAKIIALLRGLNSKAWLKYGALFTAVTTATGGRQGCKFGAIICISVYEQALGDMREDLRRQGIGLRLKAGLKFLALCKL